MRIAYSRSGLLSKFERQKEEIPKVSPNFENRLIHNELMSS